MVINTTNTLPVVWIHWHRRTILYKRGIFESEASKRSDHWNYPVMKTIGKEWNPRDYNRNSFLSLIGIVRTNISPDWNNDIPRTGTNIQSLLQVVLLFLFSIFSFERTLLFHSRSTSSMSYYPQWSIPTRTNEDFGLEVVDLSIPCSHFYPNTNKSQHQFFIDRHHYRVLLLPPTWFWKPCTHRSTPAMPCGGWMSSAKRVVICHPFNSNSDLSCGASTISRIILLPPPRK